MAKTKEKTESTVEIQRLVLGTATFFLLGSSALMMNRLAKKAKEELLLPGRRKNKAALEATMKHDPPAEYRDSIYRCREAGAPTLVHMPAGAFKKAMSQAAIDIPGASKAQIGRLVKIMTPTVHIYGKPYLSMLPVRLQGIRKTPDIRTRAIFPKWCCKIEVRYVRSIIREVDVTNLVDAAGIIVGVGDGRTEKGTFDLGSWEIVQHDDPRWHEIVKSGGRKIQEAAMADPEADDADSEEMLAWYLQEIVRRERDRPMASVAAISAAAATGKRNGGRARRKGSN
jgi:hypothetical protein